MTTIAGAISRRRPRAFIIALLPTAERIGRAGLAAALQPFALLVQAVNLRGEVGHVGLQLGDPGLEIGVLALQGVGGVVAHGRRRPKRAKASGIAAATRTPTTETMNI